MATLKEFEEALRSAGMSNALAILDRLKKRDREIRSIAPARRVVGRKMTAELARSILDLHATTGMTQQEIAFKLGVNQGRVNEVIKRGKWLSADPHAPEVLSRDKAMDRLAQRAKARRETQPVALPAAPPALPIAPRPALSAAEPIAGAPLFGAAKTHPPHERVMPRSAKVVAVRPAPEKPRIISAQLAFLDL